MTILRDQYDNKIIRNLSEEIVKTPPIIDISSDYGVTKDGGNLVSKVKNRYNHNVFRAPSGNEPIENGDGFEFAGGDKYLRNMGFDYSQPFMLEMWHNSPNQAARLLYQADVNIFTEAMEFRTIAGTGVVTVNCQIKSSTCTFTDRTGATSVDLTPDSWNHLLMVYDGRFLSDYHNGIISRIRELTAGFVTVHKNDFFIGRLKNYAAQYFQGNVSALKVQKDIIQRYNSYDYETSSYKHANLDQAFTPPTYPNTIL